MPNRSRHEGSPALRHLKPEQFRSLVIQVRQAVEEILANNILHHFTDHSVNHSDSLCELVDDLITDLQKSDKPLNDDELIVLYSACYLHDLGMQYENAGNTRVIQGLNLTPTWDEIDECERLELLRKYHHKISAELVAESVGSGTQPIDMRLSDAHHPAQIACLCEAHCVTPTSPRYFELMSESPRLRMRLLSGLLRLADILDESRHRACPAKARTLQLNLESQTHWWRHYFTKDVKVSTYDKKITIWFEYPIEQVAEYKGIIPQLQVPWIQQELDHHRDAFNQAGIGWTLQLKTDEGQYRNVDSMPDSVMMEMLKQLRQLRLREEQQSRDVALRTFKEARPLVERRLASLNERKDDLPIYKYISELALLANDLWELGSRRSGWMALSGEFERLYSSLSVPLRVKVGTRLLHMLLEDDEPEFARGWVQQFDVDVTGLPSRDQHKSSGLEVLAKWYLQMCGYNEAIEAFSKAISFAQTNSDAESLNAQLREMHFLQGEIEKALGAAERMS